MSAKPPRATKLTIVRPTTYMTMNDRDHWRAKAAKVKRWRWHTAYVARGLFHLAGPRTPSALSFVFEVPDRRRRDPHNYYPTIKAIVDGLVDAGLWPDDTPEYVSTTEPTFAVVKRGDPQHVHVTITERQP